MNPGFYTVEPSHTTPGNLWSGGLYCERLPAESDTPTQFSNLRLGAEVKSSAEVITTELSCGGEVARRTEREFANFSGVPDLRKKRQFANCVRLSPPKPAAPTSFMHWDDQWTVEWRTIVPTTRRT